MHESCALFERQGVQLERRKRAQRLFSMQTWGERYANLFLV